ncbi:MAG: hypothetical protein ABL933_16930 [Methyloglobulus sp.]|nr:hypothetical protein [Methyloglobulus sp.]
MKRVNLTKTALTVAMAMASGYMGSAAAHELPTATTSATVGTLNANYDVYRTTCYSDANAVDPESASLGAALRLRAAVSKTAGTGSVKVTLGANRAPNTRTQASCSDSTLGGYVYPADYCGNTQTTLAAGNGEYTMVVNSGSTTTGVKSYNVVFHCENGTLAAPVHTGTGHHLGVNVVNGVPTASPTVKPLPFVQEVDYN